MRILAGSSVLSIASALLFFSAVSAQGDVVKGTYTGTARTVVNYLNPATFETIETETYRRKLTVRVTNPKRVGRTVEANPFSLSIAPFFTSDGPQPGKINAASARQFTINGSPFLLQYWVLDNTGSGFEGELVNNHRSDGFARDAVVALFNDSPRPFIMHDGSIGAGLQSRMVATTNGNLLNITIAGYAFVPNQAIVEFRTTITSRRP